VGPVLTYITAAVGVLGVLALAFGALLAVAHRFFHVRVDPRQAKIEQVLPGANCGSCGYGGCAAYAEAVANGEAPPDQCAPGGPECARRIADVMGIQISDFVSKVAVVKCQGSCQHMRDRFRYIGEQDCRAAAATQYGQAACPYGCLGLGTCVRACPFDAMVMDPETRLPRVLEERCTGCGTCAEVCPKNIIEILPADQYVHVLCRNRDSGKAVRQVCEVGCIACHRCEKVCPVEGSAIHVNDNLAEVDRETCIDCGKCVQACPVGCIGNFRKLRKEAETRAGADAA